MDLLNDENFIDKYMKKNVFSNLCQLINAN